MDLSFENESSDKNNSENTNNIIDDDAEIEIQSACENHGDNIELKTNTAQKVRNKFKWHIQSEWTNLDEALDFLEDEGFVNYDYSDLKCGMKFYFRCKRIPKERETWCAIRYTLFLPSDSMKILILRNQFEHNHDQLLEGVEKPTSDEMIEFIVDLFKCGTVRIPDIIRHIEFAREKHGLFADEKIPQKGDSF